MILWLDAQLSPQLAPWLEGRFGLTALAVRDLGLRDATGHEIFAAARDAGVVVITKDRDFTILLAEHGPPPQVLWLTCGNISNSRVQAIFAALLPDAVKLLESGEPLVEIADAMQ
jgi:predicted nuclease of predicted toxin-antitoxin system